ncbi:hypothetical protein E5K00_04325 [Hymenobacter aquaticus]|uniref:Uncharacterized protein n=1 Tax=Hymenobacter aquaticus TaxID=1867101 RepID=A0A4Z0Q2Z3_9BACT|nr:AAA family ATPase [Hymenobacter aquaticus]TGE24448.1 hypothetical protein E5K00_04325 [Hymenobacter aquaticus]
MENNIKTLRIQNFKSIKDVTMEPRRVNLIIGMPNVGKSNILEAMSLLGGGEGEKNEYIRYEEIRQIFRDNLIRNSVKIETDKQYVFFGVNDKRDALELFWIAKEAFMRLKEAAKKAQSPAYNYPFDTEDGWLLQNLEARVDKEDKLSDDARLSPGAYIKMDFNGKKMKSHYYMSSAKVGEKPIEYGVKVYNYAKNGVIDVDTYHSSLLTPDGKNLITVIQAFPELRKEIARMFDLYGLKLLLRIDARRLEIVKDMDGISYSYPYSSIADTLQRIIFYLAAIESNDDAVILLEEPEAHSYPMYVSMLGKRMVESRNNQFFVATHSPYLITEVLEQMLPDEEQAKELAIFVAYYEDYQTKVKQLSDEEVQAIRGDSVDVFYNMARYIPRPAHG